ncbi:MAG: hypothetical protein ACE5HH_01995 [Candidatus Hydrothermarchaeales archaeon]
MNKKTLVVLVLVVIVAAGLSYQVGTSKYQGVLEVKEMKISQLEKSIQEAKAAVTPAPKPSGIVEAATGDEVNCLACHELAQTKAFHVPQTIMKIDERAGKRRRTCVDCHGPNGPPWSADEQQTPLSMIPFNESIGPNGLIEISSEVPHGIHKKKLDSEIVECQSCHGTGTKMVIPVADTGKGHVLVCQNCKFHPEEGNYITIHVELAGKKCSACHTGGVIEIHQEKTKELGQV